MGSSNEMEQVDLIDRQAAIDICNAAIDLWHGQIGEGALVAVRDKIAELTPAEPKKERWIEISSINHTYKCSECGRLLVNVADGRNNVSKHYPYCHCGADMRGGQDDESRSNSNAQTNTRARGMGATDKSSGI